LASVTLKIIPWLRNANRLLSLNTEEELWNEKGRCSTLELKEAARGSVMVLLLKDMSFILVSAKGCKLQCRDSRLLSDRFSAPTFSLLTLHRRHHKGTTMHIILVFWDHVIVVVRLGTMLIGVQGSRQIRLQL
jgi:hypothetical protein